MKKLLYSECIFLMRPGKIHEELEKAGADPDFVRYMISRKDLDGEYYNRVFGGEDSDSDMDVSVALFY